jgi:microcystin-dependent protein
MTPFLGEIRMFAGNFAPQGWANCDGSLIAVSQNDSLFALIGPTYGGDGQTDFALPNLLGRVPIHRGQGHALRPYVVGTLDGSESVALLPAHHPSHTHALSASTDEAKSTTLKGQVLAASMTVSMFYAGSGIRPMGNDAISPPPDAKGLPHENRMPSLAITYIIAMAGVWPSQG